MNVLHVIPSVSRRRGGPSQALLELCRSSRDIEGITHSVIATTDDGDGVLDVDMTDWSEFDGARIKFFTRWSPSIRPVREFAYGLGMKSWLKSNIKRYDIVHIHALFSYAPSTAMQVSKAASTPYIVRPSGLLGTWPMQQSRFRKNCFLKFFDRAGLNGAAALEFTSELEQTETKALGLTAPSYILPYGMDFADWIPDASAKLRAKYGISTQTKVLLFLSRIHPKKGLETIIDALSELRKHDWIWIIAGSGDSVYEKSIRDRIELAGLSDRIKLVGFVAGDEKQLLLQGADLFLLPSFSESFAIAVMEAIASGCPVVTTHGVPMSTVVTSLNFGWVAPPESADQRAVILSAFSKLDDVKWRQSIRDRGRSTMFRNFSWEAVALKTKQAYQSILDGRLPESSLLRDVK